MNSLAASQQAELKRLFRIYDMQGTGTVAPKELVSILKAIGITLSQYEVQDLISRLGLSPPAKADAGSGAAPGGVDFIGFVTLMTAALEDIVGNDAARSAASMPPSAAAGSSSGPQGGAVKGKAATTARLPAAGTGAGAAGTGEGESAGAQDAGSSHDAEVRALFRRMDADGDGELSLGDLQRAARAADESYSAQEVSRGCREGWIY